jgi:hypothetical protein
MGLLHSIFGLQFPCNKYHVPVAPLSFAPTGIVLQVATVDSHLFLPNWIVNWVIANIAYLMLPMLFKQSKHYAPGGKLHDRITSKPEMYGEIRRRLEQLEAENADSTSTPSGKHASSAAAEADAATSAGAAHLAGADSAIELGPRKRGMARNRSVKKTPHTSVASHTPPLLRPLKGVWPFWAVACAIAAVVAASALAKGQLTQSGAGLGVCFASSSALVGPGGAAALHCAALVTVACLGN